MVSARVNFEFGQHFAANLVLWQHPANGFTHDVFGLSREAIADCLTALTGVSGVPCVLTLKSLVAGVDNLFTVGHDDKIASVLVGRVGWLVLAHQNVGNVRSDATNGFVLTVNDEPFLLEFSVKLCVVGFCAGHDQSPFTSFKGLAFVPVPLQSDKTRTRLKENPEPEKLRAEFPQLSGEL